MYGSLTTIILIMLWLYGCMYIILLGGEINALLEKFLQRLDHSDAAAVRLAYGLYERCETDDLTLRDYYDCLYGKKQKEDEARLRHKKLFSKDEGEYVDFEEIKE